MIRVLPAALAAMLVMPAVALADNDPEREAEDKPAAKSKSKAKAKDDSDEDKPGGEAADTEPAGKAVAVGEPSGRMTMPGGKILINAIVEANFAKGATGKPFSVAPDIWYGASDRLTLGLVHSGRGASGFLTGFGRGLCFRGKDGAGGDACGNGLGKVYTSGGVEARIGLTEGGFPLALALGAQAEAFKPELILSAKIGLLGRWQSNRVAFELAPTVLAGITQRKVKVMDVETSVNEDVLSFPVTLFLKLSPSFAIAAQAGITLVIEHAADTYQVPAALGLAWWVTPKFSIDLAFGLTAVVDKNDMTKPFDGRSLSLGVGYGM